MVNLRDVWGSGNISFRNSSSNNKGKELNYNPNFRLLDVNLEISDEIIRASLYVDFSEDWMSTKLILLKDSNTLFEIDVDRSMTGNEFFMDNYKDICVKDNFIVIKTQEQSDSHNNVLNIDKSTANLYNSSD
ncbi:hypothetical protein [Winogradskyella sp.]|uniref:hypothetical protein n=1 Tax=Winogradskyella sp. TaxID=1883156 RepID=UPI003BAC7E97